MGLANGAIRLYQRYVSPDYNSGRGSRCAFHPSCSEYTRQAVESEGLVQGGLDGYLRMLGCNGETHDHHLHEVVEGLRTDPDGTGSHLEAADPGARRALESLRDFALHADPADPGADRALRARWTDLSRTVQLTRADRPGHGDLGQPARFRLATRPPAQTSPGGHPVQRALAAAAGLATGTLAGLLGSAVGLAVGLVTGAVAGGMAGGGALEARVDRVEERHGELSARGLEKKLNPVTCVGRAVGRRSRVLGVALGAAWGAAAGMVGGLVAGAGLARFGAPLGRNLAGEALGLR